MVRFGSCEQEVTVGFKTVNGDAEAGSDYEGMEGTLCFPPAEFRAMVRAQRCQFLIIGDTDFSQVAGYPRMGTHRAFFGCAYRGARPCQTRQSDHLYSVHH